MSISSALGITILTILIALASGRLFWTFYLHYKKKPDFDIDYFKYLKPSIELSLPPWECSKYCFDDPNCYGTVHNGRLCAAYFRINESNDLVSRMIRR